MEVTVFLKIEAKLKLAFNLQENRMV